MDGAVLFDVAKRIDKGQSGVVDLRTDEEMGSLGAQRGRIKGALVVGGREGLKQRFSWLPPPGKGPASLPLVILVKEAHEREEVMDTLSRWNIEAVISQDGDDGFWQEAMKLDLIRARKVGEYDDEAEDSTKLLFAPSPILNRAMSIWETGARTMAPSRPATLLDLGCGAGRDMAWAVRRSAESPAQWLVTGVDNLEATIKRVRLLASDLRLNKPHATRSRIESIIWGQTTPEGNVETFPGGDTVPHKTWDLILIVRFLPRALLAKLDDWTHHGSLLALSHFVHGAEYEYDSPPIKARLQPNEIQELINTRLKAQEWTIVSDVVDLTEDGRPLRSVIVQRSMKPDLP